MKTSSLIPEDDLILEHSIEAGAFLEALAKGKKKIPDKRKRVCICIQYYHLKKRRKSELFNSPNLSFFDKCIKLQDQATLNHQAEIGDEFSNCLAKFGRIATHDFVNKSAHGCHESTPNDYIDGSMGEDRLCKPENVCFLLRDNLMSFFDPDIESKDDTHMHDKGDLENVCILNTEDTIDNIPNSQLLDFAETDLEVPSFHGDQQDVCHCEDDVVSTSISHVDPIHLSEGKITCILNTEDPEVPCNDNNFLLIHPSPYVSPQTATESIDLASSFTQSQMDGPDLSSEFDSANLRVGYTLKSVSMDHSPISDHNNSDYDSDLSCFPDNEDQELQSPSVRPQTATDSLYPTSCFTQSQIDGPDITSEFDSANPHLGCTLKSVSVDHNPSISDHNSDSDLHCFPDTEDPEIPSPSVRPQTTIDGPVISSEFDSANPHLGCTLQSVSVDHNPSISDHNSDSDLHCFPDTEDPEIPSPSVRPQTTMDGPDISSEFDSANPHLGCTLQSVSVDHNPSISDQNGDSDLHCFPDTEDPEIPSPSVRPQTTMDGPDISSEFDSANPHFGCTLKSVSVDHNPSISDRNSDSGQRCFPDTEDPEIPSPSVRPQTTMDGPDISSEFDSANPHLDCTLKSVSVDHNPSISDHNSDSDLHCFPDTEDPEIPSPPVRPQTTMDGPDISSEFDSANPHLGCTLKSVSVDHNPSISDRSSDSELRCFPDTEDPEIPSPSVRPQTTMDGPDISSEFDSANPHLDYTLKSVSVDHNPSISDHNSDSDVHCFPDIEDPEIPSPSFRPQTTMGSVDPTSCFTRSQMDDPDLSSEFDSANPYVSCILKSVPMDHNPSISDHNSDSDLPCFPDIEDPEIPSPSVRLQAALDSIDLTTCFTMDDPELSSEFDSTNPHVRYTLKSVSMDHNPSMSDHNSASDLACFPDTEDPEIPSFSVKTQTATNSMDPASSSTQSQIDGPDLSSEFDTAYLSVRNTLKYVSVDHNAFITDHNNSDSDSDLPCFPDIEALIRKLDFEYAQESWITNEVKRGKYNHPKWSINRLEQSSSQRATSSLGAFAVFYSHHFNYYIKKTEVTIGRSTDDSEVDIDLRKESHANMISRQQATIKMEADGTFTLKNVGKGSILMHGKSIARGQVAALGSTCLIQIRGMDFMFEMNDRYVRWYLDNIMMKTQGKFASFDWSIN